MFCALCYRFPKPEPRLQPEKALPQHPYFKNRKQPPKEIAETENEKPVLRQKPRLKQCAQTCNTTRGGIKALEKGGSIDERKGY